MSTMNPRITERNGVLGWYYEWPDGAYWEPACNWCLRWYGSNEDHPLRMAGARTTVGASRHLRRAATVAFYRTIASARPVRVLLRWVERLVA